MATRAPSATNSRAVAKPMPLLPPVIKAVLVSSFIFGVVIKFSFALPLSYLIEQSVLLYVRDLCAAGVEQLHLRSGVNIR
jgi:hypothetical protein